MTRRKHTESHGTAARVFNPSVSRPFLPSLFSILYSIPTLYSTLCSALTTVNHLRHIGYRHYSAGIADSPQNVGVFSDLSGLLEAGQIPSFALILSYTRFY